MIKMQYQILRYIHDRVSGEFVNIGIVLYQPDKNFLKGKFIGKYSRISQFFTDVNGSYLISMLKKFNYQLAVNERRLDELFTEYKSLSEITNSILPKDDSALSFSELMFTIDLDPELALHDLFDRLVNRYNQETAPELRDDTWVWRKVYKQYFDKYGISGKLKEHAITTNHDIIEFDKAWKNGKWNIYQSLSFDLKRPDSIKNKVYKWSGILNEIENTQQELNLYFLTTSPSRNKQLQQFINETLIDNRHHYLKVIMVNENEAEQFAISVKGEIDRVESVDY